MDNVIKDLPAGSYCDLVRIDIKDLELGSVTKAKMHNGSVPKYRMTLKFVAGQMGFAFKTKTSLDGNVWIKRTK